MGDWEELDAAELAAAADCGFIEAAIDPFSHTAGTYSHFDDDAYDDNDDVVPLELPVSVHPILERDPINDSNPGNSASLPQKASIDDSTSSGASQTPFSTANTPAIPLQDTAGKLHDNLEGPPPEVELLEDSRAIDEALATASPGQSLLGFQVTGPFTSDEPGRSSDAFTLSIDLEDSSYNGDTTTPLIIDFCFEPPGRTMPSSVGLPSVTNTAFEDKDASDGSEATVTELSTDIPGHFVLPTISGGDQPMPKIALDIFHNGSPGGSEYITSAIEAGFTHIQTSHKYGYDEAINKAIRTSRHPRSMLFVTTKLHKTGNRAFPDCELDERADPEWIEEGDASTYGKIRASIQRIDPLTRSVNMVLIARPFGYLERERQMYQVLEEAAIEGYIDLIGVCDHGVQHLEALRDIAMEWPPAVNQIELHPWCQQTGIVEYCRDQGICIQAYNPFAQHKKMDHPVLVEIARRYKQSKEAVLLRWSLQHHFCPVLVGEKFDWTVNRRVWEFRLSDHDMKTLDGLDEGKRGAQIMFVKNTEEDEEWTVEEEDAQLCLSVFGLRDFEVDDELDWSFGPSLRFEE